MARKRVLGVVWRVQASAFAWVALSGWCTVVLCGGRFDFAFVADPKALAGHPGLPREDLPSPRQKSGGAANSVVVRKCADAARSRRVTLADSLWTSVGMVCGILAGALASSAALAETPPTAAQEAERGFQLFQDGDFIAAEGAWQRCVALSPDDGYALANLGACQLINAQQFIDLDKPLSAEATGRLEAALASLEKAIANGVARDPVVLNQRGNVYNLMRRWDEAVEAYEEAAQAAAGTGIESIPRQNLALCLFELGQDEAAEKQAATLLRRDPEFIDARALLAAIRWSRGDVGGAETAWADICQGVQPGVDRRLLGRLVESAGQAVGISKYAPRSGGLEFCQTYSNIQAVRGRWPTRALNAYAEFLARRTSVAAVPAS